jgi:hypothetical protein
MDINTQFPSTYLKAAKTFGAAEKEIKALVPDDASRAFGHGSELTIAGLLGHRVPSVTGRYAHHVDRALIAAADRVSATIAARLEGREGEGARVVSITDRAAVP